MEEMSCQELRSQVCLDETNSSSELEESELGEEVSDEEAEESFLSEDEEFDKEQDINGVIEEPFWVKEKVGLENCNSKTTELGLREYNY